MIREISTDEWNQIWRTAPILMFNGNVIKNGRNPHQILIRLCCSQYEAKSYFIESEPVPKTMLDQFYWQDKRW